MELDGYIELIRAFVEGRLPVAEFEQRYLRAFKDEPAGMEPRVFAVLNQLFTDVDAYTPGLAEDEEDAFSLSEASLRRQAELALAELTRPT